MLSAAELERRLRQAYGAPRWWSDDAYTVIFQAVLVQNATWRGVERTCAAIGDRLAPRGHCRPAAGDAGGLDPVLRLLPCQGADDSGADGVVWALWLRPR